MRLCLASILAFSVSPLVMCNTCDMLGSFDRSHSHVMSRSGRPKTFRKYESVSGIGKLQRPRAARMAFELRRRFRHLRDGIEQHFSFQPPGVRRGNKTARPLRSPEPWRWNAGRRPSSGCDASAI